MSSEEQHSRAEDYCDGYCFGFQQGRSELVFTENFHDDDSEDYRNGVRRGFAARRIMEIGRADSEKKAQEALREEVERNGTDDYGFQGPKPTDEQWNHWRTLQIQIRQIGNESWNDVLLETYRLLSSYAEGVTLSDAERAAVLRVKEGVVERLVVKDLPGRMP